MLDWSEVLLRLGTAALAGGAIGLNRDLHGKAIGIRTLGIVALATSSIIAMSDGSELSRLSDAASRIIQGILTGVGFLGAGVIIHAGSTRRVYGLTSAACTWLTACLGILCGLGHWRIVAVTLVIAFALLMFGGKIERSFHKTTLYRRHSQFEEDLTDQAETTASKEI